MDPVVNDIIIFKAKTVLQLKTKGLTKKIATLELKIRAQPKVRNLVYFRISCLPISPSSFCSLFSLGIIGVNS